MQTIYLAGGCFWCTEAVFKSLKGVVEVTSGYIGGETVNPSYKQICTGKTGHAEAVKVVYDENILLLSDLLEIFFAIHVPTTLNRQGNDIGTQYRSAIFYTNTEQEKTAQNSIIKAQENFLDPIVTEIILATEFYPAEDYHREYYFAHTNNTYCQLVISPKLDKLKKDFSDKIKD
jgi:peptide-methionine (S)-S-oxide reductase